MSEIVNKFLLAGDKFMPEMRLRQPRFTYNACGPFTKNKQRIQKIKETGDSRYIYQNELDKACFQHDVASGEFEDLTRKAAFDKILRDKVFYIAKNLKYDGYQKGLSSIIYKCFGKNISGSGIKNENISNQRSLDLATQELAGELHKPYIRNFEKRKVKSLFKDNI